MLNTVITVLSIAGTGAMLWSLWWGWWALVVLGVRLLAGAVGCSANAKSMMFTLFMCMLVAALVGAGASAVLLGTASWLGG